MSFCWAAQVAFLAAFSCSTSFGYSVLTHEAIVDSLWDVSIQKLLLKRFPGTTPEDLEKAHAYVYGGCILQDMGYYPFGSKLFSDLVHYVRSGDFVAALLRDSEDADQYAFALGALAPILPYLLLPFGVAVYASAIATGGVLFAIGIVKTRWTHAQPIWSGIEILAIGALAGVVGYFFGSVLPTLLGAPAVGG